MYCEIIMRFAIPVVLYEITNNLKMAIIERRNM